MSLESSLFQATWRSDAASFLLTGGVSALFDELSGHQGSYLLEELLGNQVERLHALFGATENDGALAGCNECSGKARRLVLVESGQLEHLPKLPAPGAKYRTGML